MHPLLQEFLVATVRHWLTMLGMWLLTKGWLGGDAVSIEKFAGGFALIFVAFMWSYWNKYKHRILFLLALEAQPGTPEHRLKSTPKCFWPGLGE